jgi:hypothetical protein
VPMGTELELRLKAAAQTALAELVTLPPENGPPCGASFLWF